MRTESITCWDRAPMVEPVSVIQNRNAVINGIRRKFQCATFINSKSSLAHSPLARLNLLLLLLLPPPRPPPNTIATTHDIRIPTPPHGPPQYLSLWNYIQVRVCVRAREKRNSCGATGRVYTPFSPARPPSRTLSLSSVAPLCRSP
jgi:hypothetical protein